MKTLSTLLNLACGGTLLEEDDGRARRVQLILAAMLLSLVFAAIWGAAAGSSSPALAAGNLYKVPMVILLSTLSSIPAGMLAWKLCGSAMRASDLMLSFATGILSGTLVLAVMAPMIALYYNTSGWAGPVIGMTSTFLALTIATIVFIRGVAIRAPKAARHVAVQFPVAVVLIFVVASMIQFITIASPILPETTVFDGGIDRMVR